MYYLEILPRKNSRKYSIKQSLGDTLDSVIDYMKQNSLTYAGSPYFFTHIKLSDGSIVTQKYNGITCSPQSLKTALETK